MAPYGLRSLLMARLVMMAYSDPSPAFISHTFRPRLSPPGIASAAQTCVVGSQSKIRLSPFKSRKLGTFADRATAWCSKLDSTAGDGRGLGQTEDGPRGPEDDRQVCWQREETDKTIVRRVFQTIKTKQIGRIEVEIIQDAIDDFFFTMNWPRAEAEKMKASFDTKDGTLTAAEFNQALEDVCGEMELSAHEFAVVLEEIIATDSAQNGAFVFEILKLSHFSPNYRWRPEVP